MKLRKVVESELELVAQTKSVLNHVYFTKYLKDLKETNRP
jgi:hypothetical protein